MPTLKAIVRKFYRVALFCTVLGISAIAGVLGVVAWEVFYGDYSQLKKSTIVAKIEEETTLYFLDEKTRIGSIFESNHRRYVPIDDTPAHMINAIVAAEDKGFYNHVGVDPLSILKAAAEGILAGGRFRRGGSTITQQTVKNIVDDWEASFARKFREMVKALQLERIYSKREILEFYLNQFHVAGNGNGLWIAAKYYFNKDVRDLSLVEAAFIAGSVKGPSKYNPFIKFTKESRQRAIDYANERKNYVLRRMFEQGWISEEDYDQGLMSKVPFSRGEFRTAEVALVELIKSQLKRQEILDALGIESIDDLNIAGLQVYTTLDAQMQKSAQLAMRKNLSRLETILQGFSSESEALYKPKRRLVEDSFEFGKVEEITGTSAKDFQIKLSFGLPGGTIPTESLIRYAKLLDLAEGKGFKKQLETMIGAIKPGDILFTRVISYDKQTNQAVLELQKRPKISGGLITLDKGEVRAVISGFDTLGFNRAMYAKRQPGSVFKSIVFFAALQLGWSMLDTLDNSRQIFPYQGKFYFPRPDHPAPYSKVSMMWTGVMSENLSSVALGARLLDKLNFEQFNHLLQTMELGPLPDESPQDYHYRVSKKTGVSLEKTGFDAFHLEKAVEDMSADLIFNGEQQLLDKLKTIWLGNGYVEEAREQLSDPESKLSKAEFKTRIGLLENNYMRTQRLATSLEQDWEFLMQAGLEQQLASWQDEPAIMETIKRFRVLPSTTSKPELAYSRRFPEEDYLIDEYADLIPPIGRPLNSLDIKAIWNNPTHSSVVEVKDVKLEGHTPLHLARKLYETKEALSDKFHSKTQYSSDPYQLFRYFSHKDFRIGLGLLYLSNLAQQSGVFNKLEPVLSFPLGSNDVTASEVAKIYQTFIEGKTYRFYKKGPANQINFIRRIEDRYGNVLFEPKPIVHQLVKPEVAYQMREILGKTVTHGTGRRARGEMFISFAKEHDTPEKKKAKNLNIRIPVFGKTGSTNDFQSSYFAGFFPYPTEHQKPLKIADSLVVSSYVGYDMNKSMRRGRQRIYGGTGALPLWIDFSKKVLEIMDYKEFVDPFDISVIINKEWPVEQPNKSKPLLVDLPRGHVLRAGQKNDIETWGTTNIDQTGEVYQDLFAPGASVRSVVYTPQMNINGFSEPLKIFAPYKVHDQEFESGDELDPSLMEIEPADSMQNQIDELPTQTAKEEAKKAKELNEDIW